MNNFIPEKDYRKIIKSIPIFCIDFLIRHEDKYLLLKRKEEPMKGIYWVIGGRLRFRESINQCAMRIQNQEIGRYFSNFKLIGFSNYIFDYLYESRATHTPTLLYEIVVEKTFEPGLDENHLDYIWSKSLPKVLKESIILIENISI